MMIRDVLCAMVAGLLVAALADPTLAQQAGGFGAQEAAPADALPPLPQGAQPVVPNPADKPVNTTTYDPATIAAQARAQGFPVLPAARACKREDLIGMWKLDALYEVPSAIEMNNYSISPVQYILFEPNDTFGKLNAGEQSMEIQNVRDEIARQTSGLQQFVIQKSGMIFFYQNSVAVDSQACFISAAHVGTFFVGQMLLMPPAGQTSVRLVKVYEKIWSPGGGNGGNKNQKRGRPNFRQ